jgi:hypothetical protein
MNYQKVKEYKSLLRECFETDIVLLEKFHIYAGQGIETCVNKTFKDLQEANVQIFKIEQDHELVGYFGKEDLDEIKFLTGFFIVPKFRSTQDRKEVWNLIQNEIKQPFYCGLFEKNIPANRFIKSNGGQIVKQDKLDDIPFVVYKVGA